MNKIVELCRSHKGLLFYTILNCIDKMFTFLLPLVILIVFDDKQTYNVIEYIYSIAAIVVVFIDVQRYYVFYGYRKSDDRDAYVKDSKAFFCVLNFCFVIIGLFTFLGISLVKGWQIYILYIAVRSLYLSGISYYNYHYRLIDTPNKIFKISISIAGGTILVLLLGKFFESEKLLFIFFLLPFCWVLYVVFMGVKILLKSNIKYFQKYFFAVLKYSWPIILQILCYSIVNSYGKIYAFNNLSQQDMYVFSYTMRISLVIFMIHTSFWAYYNKRIYLEGLISNKIMKWYLFFLLLACAFSIVVVAVWNSFFISKEIPIDITFLLLMGYTFCYSCKSCYEMYFSIWNKNIILLAFYFVYCLMYILLLLLFETITLRNLAMAMFISTLFFFIVLYCYVTIHKKNIVCIN